MKLLSIPLVVCRRTHMPYGFSWLLGSIWLQMTHSYSGDFSTWLLAPSVSIMPSMPGFKSSILTTTTKNEAPRFLLSQFCLTPLFRKWVWDRNRLMTFLPFQKKMKWKLKNLYLQNLRCKTCVSLILWIKLLRTDTLKFMNLLNKLWPYHYITDIYCLQRVQNLDRGTNRPW